MAALTLSDDVTVTVTPAVAALILSNLQATTTHSLVKNGAGTVHLNRARVVDLSIHAGKVRILAGGTAASISVLNTLSIAPGAAFDLTNNDLIVNAGTFTAIRDHVLSGFGNTSGIISSTSTGAEILALF